MCSASGATRCVRQTKNACGPLGHLAQQAVGSGGHGMHVCEQAEAEM